MTIQTIVALGGAVVALVVVPVARDRGAIARVAPMAGVGLADQVGQVAMATPLIWRI